MVQREVSALENVRVVRFSGLLVDIAAKEQAFVVVRGVRGGADLEYPEGAPFSVPPSRAVLL